VGGYNWNHHHGLAAYHLRRIGQHIRELVDKPHTAEQKAALIAVEALAIKEQLDAIKDIAEGGNGNER
jgi:hypothetical protein